MSTNSEIINNASCSETQTLATSSGLEHQVHKSRAYFTGVEYTLSANETYWLTFTTDSKNVHFQDRFVSAYDSAGATVSVDVDLYEGTEFTGGTSVSLYNADRRSVNTATSVLSKGVTVIEAGELLPRGNRLRADNKNTNSQTSRVEYIMNNSTTYGLKVVNNNASAVTINLQWNWSELP